MKFLVMGLGSIGLRHAKNLLAMEHKVYGWDWLEEAQDTARESGVIILDDADDDHADLDAHLICVPTSIHYTSMVAAIKRSKHVFVEKPIADKIDGVAEILTEAKRKNLVVMVGNMLRFHPNVRLAKFMIKKPTKAIFQVLQKNERYKDPVILNWGAHEIDLALYLFGPAKVTDAIGTNERASVTLAHDNSVTSVINMDYLTEPEVRRFEVDEDDMTHDIDLTLHDWNDIYIEEMRAFIGLIEGKSDPRCATGDDGLATLKLINDAQRMAREGN